MTAQAQRKDLPRDRLLMDIARYVDATAIDSDSAYRMARLCLMDSLGCAFQALAYPECTKLLGPIVSGTVVPNGARVPGTSYELDPITAAFNLGALIRWLDFNDAFTAGAGHPSDNIGGILMLADHLSRVALAAGRPALRMRHVLTAIIKAHEIHGILALENNFGAVGLDHGWFGRVATAAVAAKLLGGGVEGIFGAVSNACLEVNVRTFRQKPNTGSRKSWQGGDSTARGVWLALMAAKGEMGYASALCAPQWGYCDAAWRGAALAVTRSFGSHVMENVMFKISYPAGAHAQSAIECAVKLHPMVAARLNDIERIDIATHEKAMKVMDKSGPLSNPADRDHCMQYVVAIGLIFGRLTARDYEDDAAGDPRIDALRALMHITEDPRHTSAFYDAARAANPAAIEVTFKDGSSTGRIETMYPIGHPSRRDDALPLLEAKFRASLTQCFAAKQQQALRNALAGQDTLEAMVVNEFVDLTVVPPRSGS
jgi:2-methylcitrate dehydratase